MALKIKSKVVVDNLDKESPSSTSSKSKIAPPEGDQDIIDTNPDTIIMQFEIEDILKLQEDLEVRKERLKSKLEKGFKVQEGDCEAFIAIETKKYINWRKELVTVKDESFVKDITKNAEVKKYERLKIQRKKK